MKNKISHILILMLLLIGLTSCETSYVDIPADERLLDGTIDGLSRFTGVSFLRGDAAVNEVFTRETGLGSTFLLEPVVSIVTLGTVRDICLLH